MTLEEYTKRKIIKEAKAIYRYVDYHNADAIVKEF